MVNLNKVPLDHNNFIILMHYCIKSILHLTGAMLFCVHLLNCEFQCTHCIYLM